MLKFIAVSLMTVWGVIVALFASLFRKKEKNAGKTTVGIFHPYCNAGGGGERVLWMALKCFQEKYPNHSFVVYTGDIDVTPKEMISNAKSRFNIEIKSDVEFIYLHRRNWVEAEPYPLFTLLGQSIGSMYLGLEALGKFEPDIFIDTMGYAFTFPIFKYIGQSKIGCYVHYPTISTDMLEKVSNRIAAHNNRSAVARSAVLSLIKLSYYKAFAKLYSLAGRSSDTVMVNSSWTENHINQLWKRPSTTYKVYPPCDVEKMKQIPIKEDSQGSTVRILSLAQFRPEKDHQLQLQSVNALRNLVDESQWKKVRLVLIGSCRNKEDEARVSSLQDMCQQLDIDKNVEFKINISYEELKKELGNGLIGLHTMWNEHFGIGVVECMAAGLIMVANNSGGPKLDIIIEKEDSRNGFLAVDKHEYAEAFEKILTMSAEERTEIRKQARKSVDRFSEKRFIISFLSATDSLFASNSSAVRQKN